MTLCLLHRYSWGRWKDPIVPITYPIMLCGVHGRNIHPEPCRQLADTQKCDIQLPLLFQHAKQQEVVNDCMKLSSLLKNIYSKLPEPYIACQQNPWGPLTAVKLREGEWQIIHLQGKINLFWACISYPWNQSWGTFYRMIMFIQKQTYHSPLLKLLFVHLLYGTGYFSKVLGCWALSFCCSTLDWEVADDCIHGMLTSSASHQTPRKTPHNNGYDLIKCCNAVKKCFWRINYFSLNKNGRLN